jgi:DNA-binding CsgD family transcriptional regulator
VTIAAEKFLASLSPRMRQLYLEMVTGSDTLTAIATRLDIRPQVAKNYAKELYARAGCDGRQHLMLWSFIHGAVECPCGRNVDTEARP